MESFSTSLKAGEEFLDVTVGMAEDHLCAVGDHALLQDFQQQPEFNNMKGRITELMTRIGTNDQPKACYKILWGGRGKHLHLL